MPITVARRTSSQIEMRAVLRGTRNAYLIAQFWTTAVLEVGRCVVRTKPPLSSWSAERVILTGSVFTTAILIKLTGFDYTESRTICAPAGRARCRCPKLHGDAADEDPDAGTKSGVDRRGKLGRGGHPVLAADQDGLARLFLREVEENRVVALVRVQYVLQAMKVREVLLLGEEDIDQRGVGDPAGLIDQDRDIFLVLLDLASYEQQLPWRKDIGRQLVQRLAVDDGLYLARQVLEMDYAQQLVLLGQLFLHGSCQPAQDDRGPVRRFGGLAQRVGCQPAQAVDHLLQRVAGHVETEQLVLHALEFGLRKLAGIAGQRRELRQGGHARQPEEAHLP